MFKVLLFGLKTSLLTMGYFFSISSAALSQVTSDGTINTQVNQNSNIAEITGGEARGSNLFHSFQDFSVETGNEAFFNNDNDISNIFSRVTGGNISNIDGKIRTNDASLFLINPAGILFGAGARLDLGSGSFYGSSASIILFEDGEFSATDLTTPPILTINAPIGLDFRDNSADITVRGDGNGTRLPDSEPIDTQDALRVNGNATIGIIGGNLIFENATIKTAGGRIEVGSVAEGRVNLLKVDNSFSFDYSGIDNFENISLTGTTAIDASGNGGGDINLAGRNISLNDSSGIEANILGDATGGEINVFATESIDISGLENENNFISAISNRVFADGTGNGGDINIETGSLNVGDRAGIFTSSSGRANAGNISINASNSVSLESQGNTSAIVSSVTDDVVGNAGNIEINSGSLTINNGVSLLTNSSQGKAGNVEIQATDNVTFANNSTLLVSGTPGGSININAKNLSILSGSRFFSGVIASGIANEKSGDIVINLTEDLIIDRLNSDQNTIIDNSNFGQGDAGNIEINARNITLSNGGLISATSSGDGDIGSITLNASGDLIFDGIRGITRSGTNNLVIPESTGNIGEINISAQNLSLTNGAVIQSFVAGIANSGDINLDIADTITIDGFGNIVSADGSLSPVNSSISSTVNFSAVGDAGDINIDTSNLSLSRNGSIVTDVTQSQGDAGDINIKAKVITIGEQGNTFLTPSSISSEVRTGLLGNPFLEANSGSININTGSLSVNDGGSIQVSASAIGNAGNITINATESLAINGTGAFFNSITEVEGQSSSDISASILSGIGNSGNLEITTANFSLTDDANIDTSNFGEGSAGFIIINADDTLIADNAFINSSVISTDGILREGNSGNIEINSGNLSLIQDSRISTTSVNLGSAGNINIDVQDTFTASDNSLITSNIGNRPTIPAVGNVGSININAREINFSDTAQIQAGLFSGATGNPGVISVNATESISFTGDNTGIFSNNDPDSVGNASDTQVSAPSIVFDGGAGLTASNSGEGSGGNIKIDADNLSLENNNFINAITNSGFGGTVTLQVEENIVLRSGNTISASALADANGGNINIDANFIVAFPNGNNDIIASAERGNGGNININAESLLGIQERALSNSTNDINASSEFSLDGNITIDTPDLNPVQGVIELPQKVVEPGKTTAQVCQANRETEETNTLAISGKGGIPTAPSFPLDSGNISINGDISNPISTPLPSVETSQGKIQPARGIKITEMGEVILTAYRTNNSGDRLPEKSWCS